MFDKVCATRYARQMSRLDIDEMHPTNVKNIFGIWVFVQHTNVRVKKKEKKKKIFNFHYFEATQVTCNHDERRKGGKRRR